LALLLLAGCDSQEDAPPEQTAGSQTPPPAVTPAGSAAQNPAQAAERAKAALAVILVDPKSARYSEVRSGTAGAVCGRVDSMQGDGKYSGARPFVVTPEGVAVISTAPRVMFGDPEDVFPDFYIRWCASPEELRTIGPNVALADRLGAELEAGGIETVPEFDPADAPPVPEAPPPAAPPGTAPAAPAAAPANPPAGGEDSFSSAVLRKRPDPAPKQN
jgi:hypothetical protein